jgi:hypothetical protein
MGIMDFQRSRFLRATACVTLVSMLAGCLPGPSKSGDNSAGGFPSSVSGLMDSLSSAGSMVTDAGDALGIKVPGSKKGSELRDWSETDKAGAERAKAAFSGKSPDGLPIYNPTVPGEQARYKDAIQRLVAKYNGRKDLTPEEMMEVAKVVVPVARFISQSRAYQDGKKSGVKVLKNTKGNSSVVIPPGMTVEIAMLTYCNDHGLPAPWSGEKLHFRSSQDYMAEELLPIYKGLHTVAATNPNAHYKTQNLVWWLRDTPCKNEALSDADKQLLKASDPKAMATLQTYCMKQRLKEHATNFAKQYIPAGAWEALNQYNSYMAQAQNASDKANAFLTADLTDPAQVLQLAQSAGLTKKLGKNNLLNNKYLKQAIPLLKKSGFTEALVPNSAGDKAVAASLAAMEVLGDEIGAKTKADKNSLANYTDLGDGLYAENIHSGGADSTAVRITNTGTESVDVDGSDYVLTTVDDPDSGRSTYTPTQRLSIGPMLPIKAYPNVPNADKLFTDENVKKATDLLENLTGVDFRLEPLSAQEMGAEPAPECDVIDQIKNVNVGDIGLNVLGDVLDSAPIISNVLAFYNLYTGSNWRTGEALTPTDFIDSALTFVSPPGAGVLKYAGKMAKTAGLTLARKAIAGIRRSSKFKNYTKIHEKFDTANSVRNDLKKGANVAYALVDKDACKATSNAVALLSSKACKGSACKLSGTALSGVFEYDSDNPPDRDGISFIPKTPEIMKEIGGSLSADFLNGLMD